MIVPMKRATIYALRRERDGILAALQKASIMMIRESDGAVKDEMLEKVQSSLTDAKESLGFINKYRGKKGMFGDTPSATYEELTADKTKESKLCDEARRVRNEKSRVESDISVLKSRIEQLAPWLPLKIAISELHDTKTSRVKTGYVPVQAVSPFTEGVEEIGGYCELLGASAGTPAALVVFHKSDEEQIVSLGKSLGFIEASPPSEKGTAADETARLEKEIEAQRTRLRELHEEAKVLSEDADALEILYDKLGTDAERLNTPFGQTETTFFIEGWVEEDREKELDEILKKTGAVYELVLEEPEKDEKAPTKTKNGKFVTQFETLTDMYSRPNPLEGVDPTPVMAPWYWLIFGMMMADAGYGVVMALLFWAFIKLKKPKGEFGKLVRVLMYASVTTAFWGVMFGSYFGAEWFKPILFTPLYNPIPMMIMCFVIGAVHIFVGLIMNMRKQFKEGDVVGGIFDNLSWIILITGAGRLFLPPTATIGKIMAIVGAAMIVLMSKRDTWNPIKRLSGGLLSLYNITSYVSDILSYSRILALMMSSAVVAMVMNMLAQMVQSTASPVMAVVTFIPSLAIYIVGHVFNLAMGLLSAYVHASRLQYIEFYGKFYEGGGYQFKPLSVNAKYTEIK
ncbi:MAG: V-type ATP synthase subunit I [Ruminococcaceae bacterium]|nr:V-type ATP synthase subunit I [Oscillospiraceae bacterium]